MRKRGRQGAAPMLAGVVAVVDMVRARCRRRFAGEAAMVNDVLQLIRWNYDVFSELRTCEARQVGKEAVF